MRWCLKLIRRCFFTNGSSWHLHGPLFASVCLTLPCLFFGAGEFMPTCSVRGKGWRRLTYTFLYGLASRLRAGYPNGDAALAKLCLVFCSDAFEEGRDEDLFYVNDMKVRCRPILFLSSHLV